MIHIRVKANHLTHAGSGALLTLSAYKGSLLDALDTARVPYGSGEYALSGDRGTPEFLKIMMEDSNPSLAEMNYLAERKRQINPRLYRRGFI